MSCLYYHARGQRKARPNPSEYESKTEQRPGYSRIEFEVIAVLEVIMQRGASPSAHASEETLCEQTIRQGGTKLSFGDLLAVPLYMTLRPT